MPRPVPLSTAPWTTPLQLSDRGQHKTRSPAEEINEPVVKPLDMYVTPQFGPFFHFVEEVIVFREAASEEDVLDIQRQVLLKFQPQMSRDQELTVT